jgi:hypothetical protein
VYGLLANLAVLVHAAFVVFVVAGGLLVWRVPRVAWVHLPAVAWGVMIEWSGGVCPLTPLELWLRDRAGQAVYRSDFIEHYVTPVLYPDGLTRELQIGLGVAALLLNVVVYAGWLRRRRGSATSS